MKALRPRGGIGNDMPDYEKPQGRGAAYGVWPKAMRGERPERWWRKRSCKY